MLITSFTQVKQMLDLMAGVNDVMYPDNVEEQWRLVSVVSVYADDAFHCSFIRLADGKSFLTFVTFRSLPSSLDNLIYFLGYPSDSTK